MNGLGYALLAAFLWGIAPIFAKLGLSEGQLSGPNAVIIRFTGAMCAFLVFMAFVGRATQWGGIMTLPPRVVGYLFIEGICGALLGHFAYYEAMRTWDASRVVGVTGSFPVFTVLLAAMFLGEALTWGKLLGMGLIVAGVLVLKLY
ncbi:MAG TPA: EamA family transporter [bacterium]|nr:EamA family transporter [bacterium]